MNLREALAEGTQKLADAGIESAARDARALLAEAAGIDAQMVTLEGSRELGDPEAFEDFLARRINREPVSKILGRRLFWGREFRVTADTLDPRPETETLIAAALELGPPTRFADLGTGTGIIAVSLLSEWQEATAVATDVSSAALAVARENAERHGVADRLSCLELSSKNTWLPEELGQVDLILSNPPYISADEMLELSVEVRDHDPLLALTPGGDGLDPYRAIAQQAASHLSDGGWVLVEIGWRQGPQVQALFEENNWAKVAVLPDLDGKDRVVRALKPGIVAKNHG